MARKASVGEGEGGGEGEAGAGADDDVGKVDAEVDVDVEAVGSSAESVDTNANEDKGSIVWLSNTSDCVRLELEPVLGPAIEAEGTGKLAFSISFSFPPVKSLLDSSRVRGRCDERSFSTPFEEESVAVTGAF